MHRIGDPQGNACMRCVRCGKQGRAPRRKTPSKPKLERYGNGARQLSRYRYVLSQSCSCMHIAYVQQQVQQKLSVHVHDTHTQWHMTQHISPPPNLVSQGCMRPLRHRSKHVHDKNTQRKKLFCSLVQMSTSTTRVPSYPTIASAKRHCS